MKKIYLILTLSSILAVIVIVIIAIFFISRFGESDPILKDNNSITNTSSVSKKQTKSQCQSECIYRYPDISSGTEYSYRDQRITKDTHDKIKSLLETAQTLNLNGNAADNVLNKVTELLINDDYATQERKYNQCIQSC